MHPEGGSGCAAGAQTLWILCRASPAGCARVFCSVGRLLPRALSSVYHARHGTRNQKSLAPFRAMGAGVLGAVRPSLCEQASINVTYCGSQENVLAPNKGDYPCEVSNRCSALVPHL